MTNSKSGKDRESKERRQVARKYLVFYLRIFDGNTTKILGHLVDISDRGVMLISDSAIEINQDYRLRMRLPTHLKERDEIFLKATSRWCKQDENPDFYIAGFQLHDLEPEIKKLIHNLIHDFGYTEEGSDT